MTKLVAPLFAFLLACPLLAAPKTVTVEVKGWTCGSCAMATKIALKRLDGVTDVRTVIERNQAVVTYDDAKVTPEKMVEAIGKLGYKATLAGVASTGVPLAPAGAASSTSLSTRVSFFRAPLACCAAEGLGCGSLAKPILKDLAKSPKVADARINGDGTILAVAWRDPLRAEPAVVSAAFEKRDLEALPLEPRARAAALRDYEAGKWYRANDVDRLSEQEARVIAARLVNRVKGLQAGRIASLESDLSAVIASHLTRDEEDCPSKDGLALDLTKIGRKYLAEQQLAQLRKAVEQGVRTLPGETK